MGGRARRAGLGVVALAFWVLPGSAPLEAQAERTCTAEADFTLSPGVGSEPSSGTFTTDGETGTIDCDGEQGTMGFSGNYGTADPDSCTSGGEGTVTHSFTIGEEQVTDSGKFTYGALQGGVIGGSFEDSRMSADFEVTPIEGDCVTAPITKAHVVFKNWVVKG